MTTELENQLRQIAEIGEHARSTADENKQFLHAIAGLTGAILGVLISNNLTTRDDMVSRLESLARDDQPQLQVMLAILQSAIAPPRH